jgi:hypothetical protein
MRGVFLLIYMAPALLLDGVYLKASPFFPPPPLGKSVLPERRKLASYECGSVRVKKLNWSSQTRGETSTWARAETEKKKCFHVIPRFGPAKDRGLQFSSNEAVPLVFLSFPFTYHYPAYLFCYVYVHAALYAHLFVFVIGTPPVALHSQNVGLLDEHA